VPGTVRLRLTLLYAGLFLASGAVLLAFTYGLAAERITSSNASQIIDAKRQCETVWSSPVPDSSSVEKCRIALIGAAHAAAARQANDALHSLLMASAVALAGMAVLSTVLGWLVAGRVLAPLQAITAAARRASDGTLSERIALHGPRDELKQLADTFDEMLGRLDAAFASQRRFVANASHELGTPLTIMRTAIEVTLAKPGHTIEQLEDMAAEVGRAIDQAERLIEALLTLARSDRALDAREPVDLATATEDALDAAAGAIAASGIQVDAWLQPAPTAGDTVLLERMAANLVDNAVRHNVAGGWVSVATGERGKCAFLDVANGGPVVPPGVTESLFEPFRRLDERTAGDDGHGLGLAIVRSVVTSHGGVVAARGRPAGGLEVTVTLPQSQD